MPDYTPSVSLYKRSPCVGIKAGAMSATKHTLSVQPHFSDSPRAEKRGSTNPQRKKVSPRFLRRIGVGLSRVSNPSEKLRIGTLPTEEALVHKPCAEHTVSPSETCTILYAGQSYHPRLLPPSSRSKRKPQAGEAEEAKKSSCRRQKRTPEKNQPKGWKLPQAAAKLKSTKRAKPKQPRKSETLGLKQPHTARCEARARPTTPTTHRGCPRRLQTDYEPDRNDCLKKVRLEESTHHHAGELLPATPNTRPALAGLCVCKLLILDYFRGDFIKDFLCAGVWGSWARLAPAWVEKQLVRLVREARAEPAFFNPCSNFFITRLSGWTKQFFPVRWPCCWLAVRMAIQTNDKPKNEIV